MDGPEISTFQRGAHLFRIDYGYPDIALSRDPSARVEDLSKHPLWVLPPEGRSSLFARPASPAVVILKNADRLLAWGRLRGKGRPLDEVCAAAASHPVLLQCRFPRHATALRRALEESGAPVTLEETPRDGSLPPIYRSLSREDPRMALHLDLEWHSAMACARGDASLEQVALFLARSGPSRVADVALGLGITSGAARSYLQWMEDVALVRREGHRFDLAHPFLRLRFTSAPASPPRPSSPAPLSGDDMSVD
jgi:hypothetical protein